MGTYHPPAGSATVAPGTILPIDPASLGPAIWLSSGDAYNAAGEVQSAPSTIFLDGTNVLSTQDPYSHTVFTGTGVVWSTAAAGDVNKRNCRRAVFQMDPVAGDMFLSPEATAWASTASIKAGEVRKKTSNRYRARNAGITGATGPTLDAMGQTDGTVVWDYVGAAGSGVDTAGIGFTGITDWTVVFAARFTEDATGGESGGVNALCTLGQMSDNSAIKSVMIASSTTAPHGNLRAYPLGQGASAAPTEIWGTEDLYDGTLGTAIPSYQVVLIRHWLSLEDSKWYIDLWIDGRLRQRGQASSGVGWNITADAVSIGRSGWTAIPTWLAQAFDLFDFIVYGYALTTPQIRGLTRKLLDEMGAPDAALSATHIGDSITLGANATGNAGYVTTWPARYATAYGVTPLAHNHGISGWTALKFLTGQMNGSLEQNEIFKAFEYVGVRPKMRIGSIAFGTNDLSLALYRREQWLRNLYALATDLIANGCTRIIVVDVYHWTLGGATDTERDAMNAALAAYTFPKKVEVMVTGNEADTRANPCTSPVSATYGGCVTIANANFGGDAHPEDNGHAAYADMYVIQVGDYAA